MAGQLKRESPDIQEDLVLIRALRDSNLPKFLADDAILFKVCENPQCIIVTTWNGTMFNTLVTSVFPIPQLPLMVHDNIWYNSM